MLTPEQFVTNYKNTKKHASVISDADLAELPDDQKRFIRHMEQRSFEKACHTLYDALSANMLSQYGFAKSYVISKNSVESRLKDETQWQSPGMDARVAVLLRRIYSQTWDDILTQMQVWWRMHWPSQKKGLDSFLVEEEIVAYAEAGPGGGCAAVALVSIAVFLMCTALLSV